MDRLARFDISKPFRSKHGKLAAQVAFGVGCAFAMIALRSAVNMIAPTSGPFALVYPTILLATLYGHWQAGLVAYIITFLWAWRYVLPVIGSFQFQVASDPSRVAINAAAALVILVFAETFRLAAQRALRARDQEIERRKTLHAELEHRTRNSFSLVASLLTIQQRQSQSEEVRSALEEAVGRVQTFADAYSHLASAGNGLAGKDEAVPIAAYLGDVVGRVASAALPRNVGLDIQIEDIALPREKAVALGLYINEAVTNCAKYAFPGNRPGRIAIRFGPTDQGWRLDLSDNGVGSTAPADNNPPRKGGGLGSSLLAAFAGQAGAEHSSELTDEGCRLTLTGKTGA